MKLDMYDFCTTELQKKMIDIRKKFKDVEDKKLVSLSSVYLFLCYIYVIGNKS